MRFTATIATLLTVGLVAAHERRYTCAAQNILDACLGSTTPQLDACQPNDWSCLCDQSINVLTCYNNCPGDPNAFGAQQTKTSYCNAAKAYSSSSSSSSSPAGATASSEASSASASADPSATETSNGSSSSTGSSTTLKSSASSSSTSSSSESTTSSNAAPATSGVLMVQGGLMAILALGLGFAL